MAIDTPAKIAILGAGPIGIEAALYARFLGYDVALFDRGRVAENVLRWGHVRMFSPFRMNRSPLGLAALAAQDSSYSPPDDDALLTGKQWVERYLAPLAQTDLIADHLQLGATIVAVGRDQWLKHEAPGAAERGDSPLMILLRDPSGGERLETADAVIDTTGVFGNANWMGRGGIPAIGETALRDKIEYGLPDVAGQQREHYAGRRILLVGCGYSAATTLVALAELARSAPQTQVAWATRRALAGGRGPIRRIADDRLEARDELARRANEFAAGSSVDFNLNFWPGACVASISQQAGEFEVEFVGEHAGHGRFDRIIANVGYQPDISLYRELQVHQCYASEGPMKLAAALLDAPSEDCLDQTAPGAAMLLNPEPDFYVLGAKSYGRNSQFLVSVGLEQIRQLFTIIGDRENLDLYAGARSLPT